MRTTRDQSPRQSLPAFASDDLIGNIRSIPIKRAIGSQPSFRSASARSPQITCVHPCRSHAPPEPAVPLKAGPATRIQKIDPLLRRGNRLQKRNTLAPFLGHALSGGNAYSEERSEATQSRFSHRAQPPSASSSWSVFSRIVSSRRERRASASGISFETRVRERAWLQAALRADVDEPPAGGEAAAELLFPTGKGHE